MTTAFVPADILLPKNVDFQKWACIACDQFTSEPEYWEEAEKIADGSPSALNLILPEAYLDKNGGEDDIKSISESMKAYLDGDVFEELKNALIYVERTQSDGIVRAGVVGAVDLECYDYNKGSQSLVRATEATVPDRLPPRVKIRSQAALELPHIMILIDDSQRCAIEPLCAKKDEMKKLYSFELMLGGGKIEGYLLPLDLQKQVLSALDSLADKLKFNEKYSLSDAEPLAFAMGDGNHSLAAAKAYYEQLKEQNPDKDLTNHPARYALCELVNLHSDALKFEAIHRIISDVDKDNLLEAMTEALGLSQDKPSEQKITVVCGGEHKDFYIHNQTSRLTVGSLQNFLDEYISEHGGSIDYIHGKDTLEKLSMKPNTVGFILPDMEKQQLFPTVIADGALPRKTFSMGHAVDKRYYIEARKIIE
ncbi:MAG: DUF1015 domain-containing protein [Ruminococcus sp.]|nr:DUF1015 domain-containing protein [Ruminococcus sp.]